MATTTNRRNAGRTPLAIAYKGYKRQEVKTWEKLGEYQSRGWQIWMVKAGEDKAMTLARIAEYQNRG